MFVLLVYTTSPLTTIICSSNIFIRMHMHSQCTCVDILDNNMKCADNDMKTVPTLFSIVGSKNSHKCKKIIPQFFSHNHANTKIKIS